MRKFFNILISNNKSLVLTDQAIFSGNSFIVTILMARLLTPSDFGVFSSILLAIYLVISVLNAMVIQPLQVTLAGIENKHSYVSFSFWIQSGLVLLIALISSIILYFDFSWLALYNNLGAGIIVLSSGFVMHDYFRKLFLARANIKYALIIDFLMAACQFSILIISLLFNEIRLSEMLLYLGLGYIPAVVAGLLFTRPVYSPNANWKAYLAKHYSQSKWLLMVAFMQWWSANLFVVASGIFLGIRALGAFRLVQSIFGVLNVLLQTFENYVLPQTSRLLTNSYTEATTYLKQISLKSSLIFGTVLLAAFFFSKPIIVLAGGANYADYAYVVQGMAILYFIIFIGYPIRMAIRALVLNKHFFFAYLFSLIFSLVSFNFLLSKWNLSGAIAGLIISQLIVVGYMQLILVKHKFSFWK